MDISWLLPAVTTCGFLAATARGSKGHAPKPPELPGWALGPFLRPAGANPVIQPDPNSVFDCPMRKAPIHWESLHTFNPAAIVREGNVYVLYRAEDDTGERKIGWHTSRLGLARSEDGLHFTRLPAPVLYPDEDSQKEAEWGGGCEDPRIVEAPDGTYVLTYTQWNHHHFRMGIATSPDLQTWTKHGAAFGTTGKYANLPCKSGAIVTTLIDGRLQAARINMRYWMYWGEGALWLASSEDLIHWHPVEDDSGELLTLLSPREHNFDSGFPEAGPPPVLTHQGIVVIYNGKNRSAPENSPDTGPDAYAGGQALFDAAAPARLRHRLEHPFFQPQMPYEKTGQYASGTTFLEGLVYFQDKWFLYYGCADSLVSVTVYDLTGVMEAEPIPPEPTSEEPVEDEPAPEAQIEEESTSEEPAAKPASTEPASAEPGAAEDDTASSVEPNPSGS